MATAINVLQMISAILLVIVILAQNRGSGLGATFGGDSSFYATKRGAEKILANATIIIAIAFLVLSFAASLMK